MTIAGMGGKATRRHPPGRLVWVIAASSVGIAACSVPGSSGGSASANLFDPAQFNASVVPWLAANQNASGSPVGGGTLRLEGSTDVSGALDPQGEYEVIGYEVMRTFTRQLITYPASTNIVKATQLVPDAASSMPTVSADHLTYTFTLRSGVMWNTNPPRPVTAQDWVLGLKRICDPNLAPRGNPNYYVATIMGFRDFCAPFEGMSPSSSAAARKAYITGHNISGIATPDSSTLVITLTQPAPDFLYIMAMPFASAAPAEYLNDVPLTPGNVLYSDGPYEIKSYDPTHTITLDHNPAWNQSTDQVRHNYVDEIDIQLDLSPSAADSEVQQDLLAGTADLEWNTVVPTADLESLTKPWNPQFGSFPSPGITQPFLVFNVQSPNNGSALGNVKVRQALEYAIDKVAMTKIFGGLKFNQPLNQVIAPGAQGYVPFNDYRTANNQGDPAKCKRLLQAAGYAPGALTLKDYYQNTGKHPAVFQEVQADFGRCGVTVVGTPITSGFYGTAGIGVSVPSDLKKGNWDIAEPGWIPDWFGAGNGRATLPDLFDGQSFPGPDLGGFDDPAVDQLVNQAEAAASLSAASMLWHLADEKVMADAPFIPFETQLTDLFRSKRVHNAIYSPFSTSYDLTQIWLS